MLTSDTALIAYDATVTNTGDLVVVGQKQNSITGYPVTPLQGSNVNSLVINTSSLQGVDIIKLANSINNLGDTSWSINNSPITAVQIGYIGTAQPLFITTGGSIGFNGTNSYIEVSGLQTNGGTASPTGTSDWTVETFFKLDSNLTFQVASNFYCATIFDGGADGSLEIFLQSVDTTSAVPSVFSVGAYGHFGLRTSPQTISLNTWHHFVAQVAFGFLSIYYDGTLILGPMLFSTDNTNQYVLQQGYLSNAYIGGNIQGDPLSDCWFPGEMTNFRVNQGTAIYSGSTIAVPTSPLQNLANTTLLLNAMYNNYLVDSALANTVTNNGAVFSTASPFLGTPQQLFVVPVLDGNGTPTPYNSGTYSVLYQGSGLHAGDQWYIPGTILGGASPANDFTINIIDVNSNGVPTFWTFSGNYSGTYINEVTLVTSTGYNFANNVGQTNSINISHSVNADAWIWTTSWSKIIGGNGYDSFYGVATSEDGFVYAGGIWNGSLGITPQSFLVKFDNRGNTVWQVSIDDNSGRPNIIQSVAVDNNGNVICLADNRSGSGANNGSNTNNYSSKNPVITKISKIDGSIIWQTRVGFNTLNQYNGGDNSVVVDKDNSIIFSGMSYESTVANPGFAAIKLNQYGNVVWQRILFPFIGPVGEWFNYGHKSLAINGNNYVMSGFLNTGRWNSYNSFVTSLPTDGSGVTLYSPSSAFNGIETNVDVYGDLNIAYASTNLDVVSLYTTSVLITTSIASFVTVVQTPQSLTTVDWAVNSLVENFGIVGGNVVNVNSLTFIDNQSIGVDANKNIAITNNGNTITFDSTGTLNLTAIASANTLSIKATNIDICGDQLGFATVMGPHPNSTNDIWFESIALDNLGNTYAVGSNIYRTSYPMIVKLDSAGNLIWNVSSSTGSSTVTGEAVSIRSKGGTLIFTGTDSATGPHNNIFVQQINTVDGSVVNTTYLSNSTNSIYSNDVDISPNGQIVVIGQIINDTVDIIAPALSGSSVGTLVTNTSIFNTNIPTTDGNWSISDTVGNNNLAITAINTINNITPVPTSLAVGGSLSTAGTLTINSTTVLPSGTNGGGSWTVEMWFNHTGPDSYAYMVSGVDQGAFAIALIQDSGTYISVGTLNSGNVINGVTTSDLSPTGLNLITPGWHWLVVQNVAGTLNVYIDGVLPSDGSGTGTFTSTVVTPTTSVNVGQSFNGLITNVRITLGGYAYNTIPSVPTTPLTTVVDNGTVSLLLDVSNSANYLVDNSVNNFVSTPQGVTFNADSPFANGLLVNVTWSTTGTYNATVANGGTGYHANDAFVINGTVFGGTSPANDLTIVANSLGGTTIQGVYATGSSPTGVIFLKTGTIDYSNLSGTFTITHNTNTDAVIWNSSGWSYTLGGDGNDYFYTVSAAPDGSIYASGLYDGSTGTTANSMVCKFSSIGALLWSVSIDDSTGASSGILGTDLDSKGNVIAVAINNSSTPIVTKLDPSGSIIWQSRLYLSYDLSISEPAGGYLIDVSVDQLDNILISGIGGSAIYYNDGIFIAKFTSNGQLVWIREFGGYNDTSENTTFGLMYGFRGISTDKDSYAIAGWTKDDNTYGYHNALVAKMPLDGSGTGQWGGFVYNNIPLDAFNLAATGVQSPTVITVTGGNSHGGVLTIDFAPQPSAPFAVGEIVTVTGVIPSDYNGTLTVLTCTTIAVTFGSSVTDGYTIGGTIVSNTKINIININGSLAFVGNPPVVGQGIPNGTTLVSAVQTPTGWIATLSQPSTFVALAKITIGNTSNVITPTLNVLANTTTTNPTWVNNTNDYFENHQAETIIHTTPIGYKNGTISNVDVVNFIDGTQQTSANGPDIPQILPNSGFVSPISTTVLGSTQTTVGQRGYITLGSTEGIYQALSTIVFSKGFGNVVGGTTYYVAVVSGNTICISLSSHWSANINDIQILDPGDTTNLNILATVGKAQPTISDNNTYPLSLNDRGKHIYWSNTNSSVPTTGGIISIPTNINMAFPIGSTVTIVTDSITTVDVIAIDPSTTTVLLAGAGVSQNSNNGWTVPAYGMATLLKIETERWILSGSNISPKL